MNRVKCSWLYIFLSVSCLHLACEVSAQRVPVLNQIDLPHNYYFRELYLPQLTSGPSAVAWSSDGASLIFSMAGSLWKQILGSETAEQLTDVDGYDYQPDVSPDGSQVVFVRYKGASMELMLLDLTRMETLPLTTNKSVNLEPRWSPDGQQVAFVSTTGTGHFLLYKARIDNHVMSGMECLTPDRKSSVKRYYYSSFDHAINPAWSRDGKEIFFISNREIAHGTGDIVSMKSGSSEPRHLVHHEETSWATRPDISPDGTRMVYSSYLGRSWHQLWLLPSKGGYPFQLTYGDYENTFPRWSLDGKNIAFISNREGNTSIWLVSVLDGKQQKIIARDLKFLQPRIPLVMRVQDENGNPVAARLSILDSRGKFYAPVDSWIHADDARFPEKRIFESHYFHQDGECQVMVPGDQLTILASHGPLYEITNVEVDARQGNLKPVVITLRKLSLPADFGTWWSGDVHVHMNYGGHYLNTPSKLVAQANAENLNFVYNLVVNKEQRIFDLPYFSPHPDKASTDRVTLLHGQEFHTSYWGHLGLLDLKDHFLLPDYSGYPQTAAESLFPNNKFIADRAHEQGGLAGYVHPFEQSEIFPDQSASLTNELPVDAALGKVDYYEVIGFAEHKASEAVWYKLLNCGLRIPAAAGTDAMANYASLRGPVGLNRVYVKGEGPLNNIAFQENLKKGKSFITNGPVIGLKVEKAVPGDSLSTSAKVQRLSFTAFMRSAVPMEYVEIIWNGEVLTKCPLTGATKEVDWKGTLNIKGPGWLLMRAWSKSAHPDLPDMYAYASTNPVYVTVPGKPLRSKSGGEYFLKWLDRLESLTRGSTSYRTEEEKNIVLEDIGQAKTYFINCIHSSTIR